MIEYEKKRGFMDSIKDGLSYIPQVISTFIFPQLAEGTELVMNAIDQRIIKIEERILRKVFSLFIITFGAVFIVFAFLFFLRDFLGWSNTLAYFFIGIIILAFGFVLKPADLMSKNSVGR